MPRETHDAPELCLSLGPLHIVFNSLFCHGMRYPARRLTGCRAPYVERADVHEIENPYRKGTAAVVRLWPTNFAVVAGWWVRTAQSGDETADLAAALNGQTLGTPVTELANWQAPELETPPVDIWATTAITDYRDPA